MSLPSLKAVRYGRRTIYRQFKLSFQVLRTNFSLKFHSEERGGSLVFYGSQLVYVLPILFICSICVKEVTLREYETIRTKA